MMPHTMSIYADEKCQIPEVGDIFVVKEVTYNVLDLHWGKCTHVRLKLIEDEELVERFMEAYGKVLGEMLVEGLNRSE